jgi:hypothetical protein
MNRYERLKQLLGIDADNAASFRASGSISAERITGLATDDAEALSRINASGYVKRELKADDVHVHTIEAASNRFIGDRFAFLGESTLRNIAKDAERGFSMITRHASGGGFFGGDGENPFGRTFAGAIDTKGNLKRVLVQFYMLRNHNPNGSAAPSTEDIDKGIVGGTLFDVSVGLTRGGTGHLVCDVCSHDLFSGCADHFPGTVENMTGEQIERQKRRGVPMGAATFTFEDFHAKETSFVVDGAVEGAGTAFATQSTTPAPTRATEAPMYSKELKIKLGLSENATDAEVDAKLASLQTAATDAETLRRQAKETADRAFRAKVDGKLSAEEIAQIEKLENRDALADMLLAAKSTTQRAQPPMGDPLATRSSAATPGAENLNEFDQCSEELREAIGTFSSKAELDKYAAVSPFEALKKFFGAGFSARPDAQFMDRDRRIVAMRKRAFHIA